MVEMSTKEWIKPNTMPNRMLRSRNWKMCSTVSTPGTIKDASKQARIPVAPREKSILPELRLVLSASAAIRVIRIVLPMIIMLPKLSKESPMINKPTPFARDMMHAITIINVGQNSDQNNLIPNLFVFGLLNTELLNLIGLLYFIIEYYLPMLTFLFLYPTCLPRKPK